MTAHVLSSVSAAGPGAARTVPVVGIGSRTMQAGVYNFNVGTDNYAGNGLDISDIWDDFSEVLYIGIEQMDTSTEADRRELTIDYSAEKLLIYTAFGTESGAADQGVVTVRLLAVGFA
jgi:hypothetical protein